MFPIINSVITNPGPEQNNPQQTNRARISRTLHNIVDRIMFEQTPHISPNRLSNFPIRQLGSPQNVQEATNQSSTEELFDRIDVMLAIQQRENILPSNHGSTLITIEAEVQLPNGDRYYGTLVNNEFNGLGKKVWTDGKVYSGLWLNGKRHGLGELTIPHISTYIGDWRLGKRHGYGKEIWEVGKYYEGDWCYNKMQGDGIFRYEDNTIYKGQFWNNLPHGIGVKRNPDGTEDYCREWQSGKEHGRGLVNLGDGQFFECDWENGIPVGLGTYTDSEGNIYKNISCSTLLEKSDLTGD